MKPSLKLSFIFGGITAFTNAAAFIVGAVLVAPVGTAIASYFALRGGHIPNATRLGARVGLTVSGIGSVGLIIWSVAASILWSLLSFLLTLTSVRDSSFFSNLLATLAISGLNALIFFLIALLLSALSIGVCVVVGTIVGVIMSTRPSASGLPSEN
jgi:hypothetical protein